MRKKILFFAMTLLLLTGITASADVLGEQNGGWSTYMGAFTYFHNVQFNSDSVGKQNEYYVEYTPNEDAVPIVVNGASIWGTRNIKQAEQYMQENGLRPLAGINADYFSFKTGIPMGYTIADGEIISKEYGGQDAVGFRSDGTGFIKWLDIQTTVTDGEKSIDVMYINKWCQAGFDPVYLLTDKFGKTTKTQSECIFVICTPNEGRLHVDETMSLTVDDVFIYNGEIEIPEGKVVLIMDTSGVSEYYDFLSRLHAGQTLTVANQAVGDDGTWKTAENAVSSVGGRLVTNGVANSNFEAGAAPRTAVGIKADGNIITKKRYVIPLAGGLRAELDLFEGTFDGLRIVEVEFPTEKDANAFTAPAWFGEEVTFSSAYHNSTLSSLTIAPGQTWRDLAAYRR